MAWKQGARLPARAYSGPQGGGLVARRETPHVAALLLFAAGADLGAGDAFGWFWSRDYPGLDWQRDYLRDPGTDLMIEHVRNEPAAEDDPEVTYTRSALVDVPTEALD